MINYKFLCKKICVYCENERKKDHWSIITIHHHHHLNCIGAKSFFVWIIWNAKRTIKGKHKTENESENFSKFTRFFFGRQKKTEYNGRNTIMDWIFSYKKDWLNWYRLYYRLIKEIWLIDNWWKVKNLYIYHIYSKMKNN